MLVAMPPCTQESDDDTKDKVDDNYINNHLDIILFLQTLCSLFFLDFSTMNCGTFTNNLDMKKAVYCSLKTANKF